VSIVAAANFVPVRRDPYRVLQIPPGAAPATVLDAYRRLSKLHHPDRNGGSQAATLRFQEIQLAYEELRSRAQPEGSLDERLAALEHDVRKPEARERGEHPSVTRVNDLISGLEDLSSRLDGL
jgi:curved DNA-binding protein CbpA